MAAGGGGGDEATEGLVVVGGEDFGGGPGLGLLTTAGPVAVRQLAPTTSAVPARPARQEVQLRAPAGSAFRYVAVSAAVALLGYTAGMTRCWGWGRDPAAATAR
jgi:hypothetical protein